MRMIYYCNQFLVEKESERVNRVIFLVKADIEILFITPETVSLFFATLFDHVLRSPFCSESF